MKDIKPYKSNKTLMEILGSRMYVTESFSHGPIEDEIGYLFDIKLLKSYLILIWKLLNGLPVRIDGEGEESGCENDSKFGVPYEVYMRNSILWPRRNELKPIESNLFRGQLLSNMTETLIQSLALVVSEYVKYSSGDVNGRLKSDMIVQVGDCYSEFVRKVLSNESYAEEVDKLFSLFSIAGGPTPEYGIKVFRKSLREINDIRFIRRNGIFGSDFTVEDGLIVNNICLLAFMVTVQTPKVNFVKLDIDPDIRLSDVESVGKVVERLGKEICGYKSGSSLKLHATTAPLYSAFYGARPKIMYKFPEINRNLYLREGCRALSYLKFVSSSSIVDAILGKMIY